MRQIVCGDTLETTLAIIKPDAFKKSNEIIRTIMKNGFQILMRKKYIISPEQAADFYGSLENTKHFSFFVLNLSNGPSEVLILTMEHAINHFTDLLGPTRPSEARKMDPESLRAIYGDCEDDYKNALHGSCDQTSAKREIHFFFPNFIVEPLCYVEPMKICCNRDTIPALMEGISKLRQIENVLDLKMLLAKWFMENNPKQPVFAKSADMKAICDKEPSEKSEATQICSTTISTSTSTSSENLKSSTLDQLASSTTQSSKANVEDLEDAAKNLKKSGTKKIMCTCNIKMEPTQSVKCPVCDKLLKYVPKDRMDVENVGMKSICITPSSTESTRESTSSSSSGLSEL